MSPITYKGESDAKKLLRFSYWSEARDLLEDRFFTGRHLVLSSQEGGDISTLLWMGVDPKNIIAVDTNKNALDAAKDKYKEYEVPFIHGNVFDLDVRPKKKKNGRTTPAVVSAFFDFCAPLSIEMIDKVVVWTRINLSTDAALGIAVLRARERDEVFKAHIKSLIDHLDSGASGDKWSHTMPRADVLETLFSLRALRKGFLLLPEWAGMYQSRTKSSNGVPMLAALLKVWKPASPKHPRILFDKYVREMQFNMDNKTLRGGRRASFINMGEKELRDAALRGCDSGESSTIVAGLLNVPVQRVAAWKAHRTMGTYELRTME
jgi:hypothetical protein